MQGFLKRIGLEDKELTIMPENSSMTWKENSIRNAKTVSFPAEPRDYVRKGVEKLMKA